MVPMLVLGEIEFLAPTIPIPSDRGNRTVETFYGASLRILEILFLVGEAPLDAVAGGKVALLPRANIDLGGPPETRLPLDGAAMFIDQIDRHTPSVVSSPHNHYILDIPGHPKPPPPP